MSTEDGRDSHRAHFKRIYPDYANRVSDLRIIQDSYKIIEKLDLLLEDCPADLVFIDTWGDLVNGDYTSEATRGMMSTIRSTCLKYDATPVYVHHTNKGNENIPDKSSIKGAGDFEQKARTVLFLTVFRGERWMGLVKGNDHTERDKQIMYRLQYEQETERISINHNDWMFRDDIIAELKREQAGGANKKDHDWEGLIGDEKFTHSALVKKIMETDNITEGAAKKRIRVAIKNGDIEKDENTKLYSI